MTTTAIVCPLCSGDGVKHPLQGNGVVYINCRGDCHAEFLIGATALRKLAENSQAHHRSTLSKEVGASIADGKIHLVAWLLSENQPVVSPEYREAWMVRGTMFE